MTYVLRQHGARGVISYALIGRTGPANYPLRIVKNPDTPYVEWLEYRNRWFGLLDQDLYVYDSPEEIGKLRERDMRTLDDLIHHEPLNATARRSAAALVRQDRQDAAAADRRSKRSLEPA